MTTASVQLFKRAYRLVVGSIEVKTSKDATPLDIKFSVKKTLKPAPNKATIQIWNLSQDHRNELSELAAVPVSLEAGYFDGPSASSQIFLGNLRTAFSARVGPDIITTVSSGDKSEALRAAAVHKSYAKGAADIGTIFRLLASSLGVSEGNLSTAAAAISASPLKSICSRGFVLSGSAPREMTHLCRSVGYTWCVNDGALQLQPLQKALSGEAVVVSAETGMIGSPSVDSKGLLSVETLMIPDVFPGRALKLEAEYFQGGYRVEETDHSGDSFGADWGIKIKAKKY